MGDAPRFKYGDRVRFNAHAMTTLGARAAPEARARIARRHHTDKPEQVRVAFDADSGKPSTWWAGFFEIDDGSERRLVANYDHDTGDETGGGRREPDITCPHCGHTQRGRWAPR